MSIDIVKSHFGDYFSGHILLRMAVLHDSHVLYELRTFTIDGCRFNYKMHSGIQFRSDHSYFVAGVIRH